MSTDEMYAKLLTTMDWSQVVGGLTKGAGWGLFGVWVMAVPEVLRATSVVADYFLALKSGLPPATKEIPIPHIAPLEASRRFVFDAGHPKDGVIYVQNPCSPSQYFVAANADERLAQEKLGAFVQIASSLGARSITVESNDLSGSHRKIKGQVPNVLGIDLKFDEVGRTSRRVYAEFDRPDTPASFPETFDPWLIADPVLRALVRTRLDGAMRTASVALSFGQELVIDANVRAIVGDLKVGLGGTYRDLARTTWNFSVEFWPRRESAE